MVSCFDLGKQAEHADDNNDPCALFERPASDHGGERKDLESAPERQDSDYSGPHIASTHTGAERERNQNDKKQTTYFHWALLSPYPCIYAITIYLRIR